MRWAHRIGLLWLVPAASLCGAAQVREAGVLTVAVYTDFRPFSELTAQGCSGVDVALALRLAERLKLTAKLLPFNAGENMADDLRNMVWRGDLLHYGPADVMLHVPVDRHLSDANQQALIFAPYYRESLVLVRDTRVLAEVPTAADLIGRFLAAEQGTAAASALLGAQGGALREKTRITSTPEQALQMLFSGQVAAALVTRAQAESALRPVPDRAAYAISTISLNGIPVGGWAIGMAVKADNMELADSLVQALRAMSENGELREIFAAQGLTPVAP